MKLCSMLGFYTQDAEQIDRLFRQSALMRDKGLRDDYRDGTIAKALAGISAVWQPRQNDESPRYGTTQAEAARRFVDSDTALRFMVLRQDRQLKVYQYVDGAWVVDNHRHELSKAVMAVAKTILIEMADEQDPARRDKLFKEAKSLETRRGLADVVELVVMALEMGSCRANRMPWRMFYVLKRGLYRYLQDDYMDTCSYQFTLQSPVVYDQEAQCPLWLKFIEEFCCGDGERMRFIQTWFGYCSSGDTSEQKVAVFFGFGHNGKTVLLETIAHVLGDFALETPAESLLQRKSEQSNDIAALEHRRFVIASESDEGAALAEGRIKNITGGDSVTCRKLFEEFKTFHPKFKLNLATNSKPRVTGTDNGIWRRLMLIPCNANVTEPDKHLNRKLRAEAAGILNWLVAGFQIWQRDGLIIPLVPTFRNTSDNLHEQGLANVSPAKRLCQGFI
ncbi:MAG: hypothetical protein EPN89_13485, partial [Methylovulum sp.]